jgi:hypothetical protein
VIIDQTTSEPTVAAQAPRWRMAAVAAVVLLAIGIGVVLGMALGGRRGAGLGAAADAVPASAIFYVEGRLDLPGAQRDNLRALIERFPGADADALLGAALADTLDEAMTGAPFSYSSDVAPWFDGRAAVALLELPVGVGAAPPEAVFLFGVRDPAAAAAFGDRLVTEIEAEGTTLSSSESHGVTVHSLDSPAGAPMFGDFAFAVSSDHLLVGSSTTAVTASLDTSAGDVDSMAGRSDVGSLATELPAEYAGLALVDTKAILSAVATAGAMSGGPEIEKLMADVPTLSMAAVSFAGDAVVLDSASQLPNGTDATNGPRSLADQVPADALVYADSNDVGQQLVAAIAAIRANLASMPGDQAAGLDQVEAALGGSLDELVSWIGDAAMVVGTDGEQWYGGAVLAATDADAAAATMNQLRSLISLSQFDATSGVTVSTETVAGAEVTTVRVAANAAEMGSLGIDDVAVQWAVDGDRVVIGFGDRFVTRVLELDAADSLGSSSRYQAARARAGGDTASLTYVDLAGLREAVVALLPGEAQVAYQRDVAPWLTPFDYLVGGSRVSGAHVTEHIELVLR